jgi:sulfite oxidase
MFRNKYKYSLYTSPLFTYYFLKDRQKKFKQYEYDEIKKHTTKETGIWTTYKNNVYNITNFVDLHPGGTDKIMLAAGSSVEPYWDKYTIHLNSKLIDSILFPLKIGTIKDYDENKNI